MKLDHIKHHEIDKEAYDRCIGNSLQGTLYAMSWYLDMVSPGWELLKSENYDFVMPLPVKKRFFITYLVQPPFCQQLGVFSKELLNQEIFDSFIRQIPYNFFDLQLNTGNCFEYPGITFQRNYVLKLKKTYEELRSAYKDSCLKNIKKVAKANLMISQSTDSQMYLDFLVANAVQNRPVLRMIPLLKHLLEGIGKNTKTAIWNAKDADGSLLSCALFVCWKNRIYYLGGISSEKGRQKQSMSLIIDELIHSNAGSECELDFEGSSIPNIAWFFEGFGAEMELYPRIRAKNIYTETYNLIKKFR